MDEIKVSVEFYNVDQKKLFQKYPNADIINALVEKEIIISKDEFLAYMMFIEQMERDGFSTYEELKARISSRLGDIDEFLKFANGSVQSILPPGDMMQIGFTERIGVALGLCVINKIHGLTAADWKKIPTVSGEDGHPTFDFEIASTGENFIQVENKGSIVEDNSLKPPSVSNHFSGICKKKKYVRDEEAKAKIKLHDNLYYGTIGVLDGKDNSKAKVYLIDPPAFQIEMEPNKYKLLARLYYYLDVFKIIDVREKIVKSLEIRISEIINSQDYLRFNNIPLEEKPKSFYYYMEKKMFVSIDINEAFGKVFFIEKEQKIFPYIIAFPKVIMRLIINQDFDGILEYNYNPDFIKEDVQVLIRLNAAGYDENAILSENIKFVFNEKRNYYETIYYGKVYHSSDGRIFGLLY